MMPTEYRTSEMGLHTLSHPGAVLKESLEDMGVGLEQAAAAMGLKIETLSAIVNEREPITRESAEVIGSYLGNGPETWLRMQRAYDDRIAPGDEQQRDEILRNLMNTPPDPKKKEKKIAIGGRRKKKGARRPPSKGQ